MILEKDCSHSYFCFIEDKDILGRPKRKCILCGKILE